MNRKPLQQRQHPDPDWKPKVPENGDVQLLCLWLKQGLTYGVSQSDIARRFQKEHELSKKKIKFLMTQANRFRHLWASGSCVVTG